MTTPAEVAKMRERLEAKLQPPDEMHLKMITTWTPGHDLFVNPDGPAASTMLADLVAERDRMREALEAIDYHKDNQDMNHLDFRIYAGSEARAALEGNKS